MRMYQMNGNFQGLYKTCNLSLLSILKTAKNALKRPEPQSESYTGNTKKFRNFYKIISPAFLNPNSADFFLLETAVNAHVWVMIQFEAFLTPLLATILLLKEQFDQCPPK